MPPSGKWNHKFIDVPMVGKQNLLMMATSELKDPLSVADIAGDHAPLFEIGVG
jgi:hypothetical protein